MNYSYPERRWHMFSKVMRWLPYGFYLIIMFLFEIRTIVEHIALIGYISRLHTCDGALFDEGSLIEINIRKRAEIRKKLIKSNLAKVRFATARVYGENETRTKIKIKNGLSESGNIHESHFKEEKRFLQVMCRVTSRFVPGIVQGCAS